MAFNPYINPYYGQQMYSNPMQNSQPQQQMVGTPMSSPTQDERIWVQSEAAAEAYLVAPNSFVRLWDSSKPLFYERRADMTGRPFPMEVYEYKKRVNTQFNAQDDILTLSERYNALKARVDALETHIGGKNDSESIPDNQPV